MATLLPPPCTSFAELRASFKAKLPDLLVDLAADPIKYPRSPGVHAVYKFVPSPNTPRTPPYSQSAIELIARARFERLDKVTLRARPEELAYIKKRTVQPDQPGRVDLVASTTIPSLNRWIKEEIVLGCLEKALENFPES